MIKVGEGALYLEQGILRETDKFSDAMNHYMRGLNCFGAVGVASHLI